jgi:hypothetical protein
MTIGNGPKVGGGNGLWLAGILVFLGLCTIMGAKQKVFPDTGARARTAPVYQLPYQGTSEPRRATTTPFRGLSPSEKDSKWQQVMPKASRAGRDNVRTATSPWPTRKESWLAP